MFVDGTEIEVGGELFEGAGRSYDAERALLLHGAFVGGLWSSGQLHPGGVHAAHGWRERMEGLRKSAWEDVGLCEQAVAVRCHRGKQGQENAFKGPPFNWSERGARPDPLPSEDRTRLNAQGGTPIGPKAGNASKRPEKPTAPHEKTPLGRLCAPQKRPTPSQTADKTG